MGVGMKAVTIRSFADSDVEAAVELEAIDRPQPWSARVFRDELAADNRTYLVSRGRDAGRVSAGSWWWAMMPTSPTCWWLPTRGDRESEAVC